MKGFNKITIIGVGLIGGSMGLAIKKRKLAKKIIGVAKHAQTLKKARLLGAIDQGRLDLKEAVKGSELVILATPIYSVIEIARSIAKYLDKGSIVIDVGSTKRLIVKELEKILPKDINFVGGHPLAGSEQKGVDSANCDLFENSAWIVTKTRKTKLKALAKIKSFLGALGARVLVTSPDRHDKIVSEISHLPHILASSLVNNTRYEYLPLVASGFRDTTRIASSDSLIWKDICLSNKKEIINAMEKFIFSLSSLKRLIREGNAKKILREFKKAKDKRDDYCH